MHIVINKQTNKQTLLHTKPRISIPQILPTKIAGNDRTAFRDSRTAFQIVYAHQSRLLVQLFWFCQVFELKLCICNCFLYVAIYYCILNVQQEDGEHMTKPSASATTLCAKK